MFTSKQYRDKAAEYKQLTDTAITLNEKREYQNLEQRFTTLADNEQWMVDHREQIVHAQADCAGEPARFPACRRRPRHPHRRFHAVHELVVAARFTPQERKA